MIVVLFEGVSPFEQREEIGIERVALERERPAEDVAQVFGQALSPDDACVRRRRWRDERIAARV